MYTTRRTHPKTVDSYLSIGDPYDKQRQSDARFKGRQFQTNPPKEGQLQGYFHPFTYATDNYQDTNGYRITQPRQDRRLGFGSLDARRRDEFTLDIRAQQYKELLKSEHYFNQKYADEHAQRTGFATARSSTEEYKESERQRARTADAHLFQNQVPTLLYDIGKAGGTTPICNKCSRETFYCKHRVGNGTVTSRRVGPHHTSAEVVGQTVVQLQATKPQFGRKSQIKDFYDANHLGV